ncbi:uncharacterized protein LOC110942577 [Helianthus annuus]|uniref:uncharacterized protein LOC110942577 n=1 Tax=Helianthus annuus TaxID=4232 RepID=UPI000B908E19|nr:uncharacterized protein LOC110942577 [Helianthus annuus]
MLEKDFSRSNLSLEANLKSVIGNGISTQFWVDFWIGTGPLKDCFKDLFRLANNKNATVSEYFQQGSPGQWVLQWVREPVTAQELQQVCDLQQLLSGVMCTNKKDGWVWKGAEDTPLSVAFVRTKIQAVDYQNEVEWPLWNKWISPKINIFCWRASMNRIASKESLTHRGILVGDTLCPRCGMCEESTIHLLWDCFFAKSVWWEIFIWLKIPFPVQVSSFQQILGVALGMNGSNRWKKLIGAIMQVAAWEIWKARNEKIFKERNVHFIRTADVIKEESFLLVSSRSNLCNLVWDRWKEFNIRDVML